MARPIDTGILKEAIETYDKFACLPNGKLEPFRNLEHPEMFEPYIHFRDVIKAIDGAPTVEPEITNDDLQSAMTESHRLGYELAETKFKRPQGEWLEVNDGFYKNIKKFKCSECGREVITIFDENLITMYPFCHCGADMKEPYKKSGTENEDLEARAR